MGESGGVRSRTLLLENVDERLRYAYYPFGERQRICIGNNFALMQTALIMSTVTQRHQRDLHPPTGKVRAHSKTRMVRS